MRYMLDTNICIYIIKNKPDSVIEELKRHDPEEICISSITYAELVHGVELRDSHQHDQHHGHNLYSGRADAFI